MTTAISFEGVTKRHGSTVALDAVTFSIGVGETVALLGPNGAGKSTSVSIMLGLEQPDAGTVRILGEEPGAALAAGRVGAPLQSAGFPAGVTVADVLRLVFPA